jgi:hypothetical protein
MDMLTTIEAQTAENQNANSMEIQATSIVFGMATFSSDTPQ